MKVELISITQPRVKGLNTAEELIAYCARVSNPDNQMNTETSTKLLQYLVNNKHWSPFEMASMCVSIETSRAIAAQILRHRSFSFQEFSQRYSEVSAIEPIEIRGVAETNRQSSSEIFEDEDLSRAISQHLGEGFNLYAELLKAGVAKETARFILPLTTSTKLYMHGTIRSWMHYLAIRNDEHTQKEHRLIAKGIKDIMEIEFPSISKLTN